MAMEFKQKKSLGQVFLKNQHVVNKITNSIVGIEQKNIIEIGPGQGILTKKILEKKPQKLLCIEKDKSLLPNLQKIQEQYPKNFAYKIADATKISFQNMSEYSIVVANLPYNVGTFIYLNLLLHAPNITEMVLMFQKEVAKRITAKASSAGYGRLSIISELFCERTYLFDVVKEDFFPVPKVDSGVLYIKKLAKPLFDVDLAKLETVSKLAFSGRRKMVRVSMKKLNLNWQKLQIDEKKRAENLTLEEFCKIANSL